MAVRTPRGGVLVFPHGYHPDACFLNVRQCYRNSLPKFKRCRPPEDCARLCNDLQEVKGPTVALRCVKHFEAPHQDESSTPIFYIFPLDHESFPEGTCSYTVYTRALKQLYGNNLGLSFYYIPTNPKLQTS